MKPATKANPGWRSRDVEEWVTLVNVAANRFLSITAICLPVPRMWGGHTCDRFHGNHRICKPSMKQRQSDDALRYPNVVDPCSMIGLYPPTSLQPKFGCIDRPFKVGFAA
jgi:hypothetical protein